MNRLMTTTTALVAILAAPLTAEERLFTDYGRVRDIEVLSDGSLILATDYEDGELIHVTLSSSDS
jgi:glucose/arabinose dehydrogenase